MESTLSPLPPRADGVNDLTLEESIQRWIAALPIQSSVKEAILSGDDDQVRVSLKKLKKHVHEEVVAYESAYLHLAVLVGETRGLKALSILASEMPDMLGCHICAPAFGNSCPGQLLGSKQDWPTCEGGAPLHFAVQMQQYGMVELLLEHAKRGHGIGLNDKSFYTAHHDGLMKVRPLLLAVNHDDLRMAQLLVGAGAEVDAAVIGIAMQRPPDYACAKFIFEHSQPWGILPWKHDCTGATPLSTASLIQQTCIRGPPHMLAALLSAYQRSSGDAELLCRVSPLANLEHDSMAPLIALAYHHHFQDEDTAVSKARLLLRWGADVDMKRLGKTAQMIAAENMKHELAAFLGSQRETKDTDEHRVGLPGGQSSDRSRSPHGCRDGGGKDEAQMRVDAELALLLQAQIQHEEEQLVADEVLARRLQAEENQ